MNDGVCAVVLGYCALVAEREMEVNDRSKKDPLKSKMSLLQSVSLDFFDWVPYSRWGF